MKPDEILDGAAEYIKEHGWCQHTTRRGERVCLMGAMHQAVMGHSLFTQSEYDSDPKYAAATETLVKVLREQYPDADNSYVSVIRPPAAVAHYNDKVMQFSSEAVTMLEKAAVNVRGEVS